MFLAIGILYSNITDGIVKWANTEREALKLSGEDWGFAVGGFSGSADEELTLDDSRGDSLKEWMAFVNPPEKDGFSIDGNSPIQASS